MDSDHEKCIENQTWIRDMRSVPYQKLKHSSTTYLGKLLGIHILLPLAGACIENRDDGGEVVFANKATRTEKLSSRLPINQQRLIHCDRNTTYLLLIESTQSS
mmetsp:Transcript_31402/g.66494  ORF Transcript_31402/g.66494 Transcript_31402/m.66494 type:complete len:103 (+) Transcript_31402:1610-1918(+)